jgi:HAD superfamily hydrolase (TIGR01490 family)
MKLALFDLDHTLIPFDSGMAWTAFLVARGALPASAEAAYLGYCQQYVEGTLDIRAMHRATVAPLARLPVSTVAAWAADFEAHIAPRVPAAMRLLVQRHQDAGELCAIVTATTRFIAEPFGRLFATGHVLCTEPVVLNGAYSGEISGEPCHREHKLAHVQRWLAAQGLRPDHLDQAWFYSDSASDLPLLCAVSNPVAVAPDVRLRRHAKMAGWPVLERG